ncbi:hypothetical protein [Oceanithermus sp.]
MMVAPTQTLVEVQLVTATALKLDSQIRLPSGSYRALGKGVARLVTKVRGGEGFGRWEGYVARGVARNLRDAYVHQLASAFAAAGYLPEGQASYAVGAERHTRYLFSAPDGRQVLLYVIEAPDALVWLVGWSG